MQEYDLLKWLKSTLDADSTTADDIVLESVLLAGTAAMDDQCAKVLAKENIVTKLVDLLKAKQEDDELVCQVILVSKTQDLKLKPGSQNLTQDLNRTRITLTQDLKT